MLGLATTVAAVMVGYRVSVLAAGGKAVALLMVIGVRVWLALRQGARREG